MDIDGGRSSGGLLVDTDSEREQREKMSEGTDPIDLESNPDLTEIFEAISKDPLQNKSGFSSEPFFLDVDESLETGASGNRKFDRPFFAASAAKFFLWISRTWSSRVPSRFREGKHLISFFRCF